MDTQLNIKFWRRVNGQFLKGSQSWTKSFSQNFHYPAPPTLRGLIEFSWSFFSCLVGDKITNWQFHVLYLFAGVEYNKDADMFFSALGPETQEQIKLLKYRIRFHCHATKKLNENYCVKTVKNLGILKEIDSLSTLPSFRSVRYSVLKLSVKMFHTSL